MYGLESAHLTETLKEKIEVMQRKGLRQIMKIDTTFGQMQKGKERTNNNEIVLRRVNATINTWDARRKVEITEEERRRKQILGEREEYRPWKEVIWMGEYYELRRRYLMIEILNAEREDPIRNICIHNEKLTLIEYCKKKQGGQRHNWWIYGTKYYWNDIIQERIPEFKDTLYDETNPNHTRALELAASLYWGYRNEKYLKT